MILSLTPVKAQVTLQAGVQKSWTVQSARQEAFRNIRVRRDFSAFPNYDPFHKENLSLIKKGITEYHNRSITVFHSDGVIINYGIHILSTHPSEINLLDKCFYYSMDGSLKAIDINPTLSPNNILNENFYYPFKTYKYNYKNGRLICVALRVAPGESFVFDSGGVLIAHWIGNTCYDEHDKPSGITRAEFNESGLSY